MMSKNYAVFFVILHPRKKNIIEMKRVVELLYCLTILVLMVATIVEKQYGTTFVANNVYGAWWFCVLWGLLATSATVYIVKRKLYKRFAVMLLHTAFAVILLGAFVTHVSAKQGIVHIRYDHAQKAVMLDDGMIESLGFEMALKQFDVICYPGTDAPMDYRSQVVVNGKEDCTQLDISMNNVGTYKGWRFYQSSYDNDHRGTVLTANYDPWGIGLTYTGYLMLLVGMILTLFSKKTHIRSLYAKATKAQKVAALLMLLCLPTTVSADNVKHKVVDKQLTTEMAQLYVLYNNRICPMGTVAKDFVVKLSGKDSWQGMSANEIFFSWMFYYSDWEQEPLIRIKDKEAQRLLGIEGQWARVADFWTEQNRYKLEEPMLKAYQTGDRAMQKHLQDADEKFNLVRMFYSGSLHRMFPYKAGNSGLVWLSQGDEHLPEGMPKDEWFFVKRSLDYLSEKVITGDEKGAIEIAGKIRQYQTKRGGDLLPSDTAMQAEQIYNRISTQQWPVMLALTLALIYFLYSNWRRSASKILPVICLLGYGLYLTLLIVMRWYISGHLPLSNGFETMQFMAWAAIVLTLALMRKFPIILSLGPLVAAFALLVAMLGEKNPQITSLMPVLNSPLLSVHVMVIMLSYCLFAMQALMAIQTLWLTRRSADAENSEQTTALSRLLLYPAVMLLTAGIFIGAVWANQSWGRYWGWDPKEVWALITMLIYAVPLHSDSLPFIRSSRAYNIYMLLAFMSVLVTYFGVNFLLGGMHSYA